MLSNPLLLLTPCFRVWFFFFFFLLPALQKWQLVILLSLYLLVQNLPQLHMHTVVFSPMWILLFEERYVQVRALHQTIPGPSLSHQDTQDELTELGLNRFFGSKSSFSFATGHHLTFYLPSPQPPLIMALRFTKTTSAMFLHWKAFTLHPSTNRSSFTESES